MALIFSATGRPQAVCPDCGRTHSIFRRNDYLTKPVLRYRCKNPECKCSWRSTVDEQNQILAYFKAEQERKTKQPKEVKPKAKQPGQTKPPAASKPKEPPKKSGWNILGF